MRGAIKSSPRTFKESGRGALQKALPKHTRGAFCPINKTDGGNICTKLQSTTKGRKQSNMQYLCCTSLKFLL